MMRPFFFRLAKMLDHVNGVIGASAKWLSLIMVLVQFLVVVLRYVFGIGSIQLQESILYMHAILFLTGAAYTWSQDGHVVPVSLLIIWVSFDYVSFSWAVREGSRETSGIQGIYILKSFILVFASQICLQAFSVILRGGYDLPATPNHKNDRSSLQESQTSWIFI